MKPDSFVTATAASVPSLGEVRIKPPTWRQSRQRLASREPCQGCHVVETDTRSRTLRTRGRRTPVCRRHHQGLLDDGLAIEGSRDPEIDRLYGSGNLPKTGDAA
jgi:hypothetical protein